MKFKMILIYVFFKCITDCHDLSLESIKKRHLKSKSDTLIKNTEINDINDQIENTIKPKGEIEDLPDIPIYHRGWIKYFHYQDDMGINKPKSFFRNDAFYLQKKFLSDDDLKNKDRVLFDYLFSLDF